MKLFLKTVGKATVILLFFLSTQSSLAQFKIPEIPKKQTSVYDYANLLSGNQKTSLEQKLINYSDSTSTQIVMVTVKTINNEDIGILTPKWAHEWGIGQEKEDNGVFVLLAEKERKIWISPGYGVEHKLTAGTTGSIVRQVIIPEFKKGNYYQGLDKGADAIFQVLNGTYKNSKTESESSGFPVILIIIIIIFIIIAISSSNKRGGGGGRGFRRNTATDILETIILSGAGRSSGGGFGSGGFGGSSGGFGGGGFSGGFGGGGFSGGGAGGGW